jgi:hypothetical protein
VEDQVQDKVLNKIMADPDARKHEFVAFYKRELDDLKKEMKLAKDGSLALGITHGEKDCASLQYLIFVFGLTLSLSVK